ncbi:uncharacterized, partial [Tachysurus ichikawai]
MRVRCRLRHRDTQRARITLPTSTDSSCRLALTSAVPNITIITILIHADIAPPASRPLYTAPRFCHAHERSVSHTDTRSLHTELSFNHRARDKGRGHGQGLSADWRRHGRVWLKYSGLARQQ